MPHDVFISHSSKDRLTANAVCNRLESAGIRCWVAPRDIIPGEGWSEAIMRGIDGAKVMVLVFSENANTSAHVRREVAHACDHEITVIPLRIRDVIPKQGLKYYLDELHWLDALTPPLASHLETLTTRVKNILNGEQNAEVRTPLDKSVAPSSPSKPRIVSPLKLAVAGALALVIAAGSIIFWLQPKSSEKPGTPAQVASPNNTVPSLVTFPDGIQVKLGGQQTLLNDQDLGLRDIAGKGVAVIENEPSKVRVLFQAMNETYLVTGTDFQHLTSASKVLGSGDHGEFDNAGAGVASVIRFDQNLYAFYEGRDTEGDLPENGQAAFRGMYCGIGLAESINDGTTWTKKGEIIRSAKPKDWSDWSGQSVRGVGTPSALIDATNTYVYLYYVEFSGLKNGIQGICLARAPLNKGAPLPDNWQKFYLDAFNEPGLGGKETPIIDGSAIKAGAMYPHATFSKALNKYILTFNFSRIAEARQEAALSKSGIYIALSDDGIHWPTPVKLITTYSQRVLGLSIAIESTLVLDTPDSLTGWLLYAYTPKYTSNASIPGAPLHLAGRRIEFAKH
ncbi:MAG: TIR domain-containing protein [Verrucomicrobia bacterium]|nr:TIR domain-containing protein [Verrucomicrobiota bacterium]